MCSSSSQMGKSQAIVAGDMRRSKTEDRRRASARKEEAQASKEWGAFKEGRVRFGSSWEERESPPSVPGWEGWGTAGRAKPCSQLGFRGGRDLEGGGKGLREWERCC